MSQPGNILDSPKPVDALDLHFKFISRNAAYQYNGLPPPTFANLVAVANTMGITFVGIHNGFIAVQTDNLKLEAFPRKEVRLPSRPTHLAVNCDESLLCVGYQTSSGSAAIIYNLSVLPTQGDLTPLKEVRLSTAASAVLADLVWNPAVPMLLSACISDGSVLVIELKGAALDLNSLPPASTSRCICWSQKGKQIVVGSEDGKLTQYKPDLKPAKALAAPPIYNGAAAVVNVLWISNFQFAAFYRNRGKPDEPPILMIINAPKNEPVTYINYDDVTYGITGFRCPQFYFHYLPAWNIILVGSANAIDLAALRLTGDGKTWEQCLVGDSSRAELPLSSTQEETYPIGMAVDLSSQSPVPWPQTGIDLSPMPRLLLYSHEGQICMFTFIFLGAPVINSGVTRPVPPQIFNSEIPQIQEVSRQTEPPEEVEQSAAVDEITPTPSLPPPPYSPPVSPVPIQTTFKPSTPPPPAVIPVKPETQVLKVTPNQQYTRTEEPTQLTNEPPSSQATETLPSEPEIDESVYDAAIIEEIVALEDEISAVLNEDASHGFELESEESFRNPIQRLEVLNDFRVEVEETTVSGAEEVAELKQCVLELLAQVEDALLVASRRGSSLMHQMRRTEKLDPVTARTLRDILSQRVFIETSIRQINDELDRQWEEYQLQCRKDAKDLMETPMMEDVVRTINLHRKLVKKLRSDIELLKKTITLKSSAAPSWSNDSRCFEEDIVRANDLSKLAESLLEMKIVRSKAEEDVPELVLRAKRQNTGSTDLTSEHLSVLLDLFEDASVPEISRALSFADREAQKQEILSRLKKTSEKVKIRKQRAAAEEAKRSSEGAKPPTATKPVELKVIAPQITKSGSISFSNFVNKEAPPVTAPAVTKVETKPMKASVSSPSTFSQPPTAEKTTAAAPTSSSSSGHLVIGKSSFGAASTPPSNISGSSFAVKNISVSSSTSGKVGSDSSAIVTSANLFGSLAASSPSALSGKPFNFPVSSVLSTTASGSLFGQAKTSTSIFTDAKPSSASIFDSSEEKPASKSGSSSIFGSGTVVTTTGNLFGSTFAFSATSNPVVTSSLFGAAASVSKSSDVSASVSTPSAAVKEGFLDSKTATGKVTSSTASTPASAPPADSSVDTPTSTWSFSSQLALTTSSASGSAFASTTPTSANALGGGIKTSTASIFGSGSNIFVGSSSSSLFSPSAKPMGTPPVEKDPESSTTSTSVDTTASVVATVTSTLTTPTPTTPSDLKSSTAVSSTTPIVNIFGTPVTTTLTSTKTTPSDTEKIVSTTKTTPIFGTAAASAPAFGGSATTTSSSVFGSQVAPSSVSSFSSPTTTTTPGIFAAAASGLFGSTPTTTSTTGLFQSPSTTAPGTGLFGSFSAGSPSGLFSGGFSSPTTTPPNVFATPTATTSASVFSSDIGQTTNLFGQMLGSAPSATASSGGNIFSQVTPTKSAFDTGGSIFGSTPATTTPAFGSASGNLFSSSAFGATTTTTASIFGQTPSSTTNTFLGQNICSPFGAGAAAPNQSPFGSPAGTATTQSAFGSSLFASKPVFGQSIFSQSGNSAFGNSSSIFGGSSTSGGTAFQTNAALNMTNTGPFSGGSGSVAQTGFGTSSTFNKSPGGFGSAPIFGGVAPASGFGAAPTFGAPAFGDSSSFGSNKSFGSPGAASPAFESLANQNTVGFGNIAQSSPGFGSFASNAPVFGSPQQPTLPPQQQQPSSFGGTSFSSWR